MFFEPFFSYRSPSIYVISDSQYSALARKDLEREITVLTSQANRYKAAVTEIENELKSKQKQLDDLLPQPKETAELQEAQA